MLASRLVREVPAAADALPSPALAAANGGAIAVDPRSTGHGQGAGTPFPVRRGAARSPAGSAAAFGSRVNVRFDFAWEPLGEVIYRRVRQGLLSRFET